MLVVLSLSFSRQLIDIAMLAIASTRENAGRRPSETCSRVHTDNTRNMPLRIMHCFQAVHSMLSAAVNETAFAICLVRLTGHTSGGCSLSLFCLERCLDFGIESSGCPCRVLRTSLFCTKEASRDRIPSTCYPIWIYPPMFVSSRTTSCSTNTLSNGTGRAWTCSQQRRRRVHRSDQARDRRARRRVRKLQWISRGIFSSPKWQVACDEARVRAL